MRLPRYVVGVAFVAALNMPVSSPVRAMVMGVHFESSGVESLVEPGPDAEDAESGHQQDEHALADTVFRNTDDWSDGSRIGDSGDDQAEAVAAIDPVQVNADYTLSVDHDFIEVASGSAVPLPASVWLLASGLLLLVASRK